MAAISGTITNVAARGAVNLVNNQLHVGRAARDTLSPKSLESMGKSAFASAITAGITQGAGFDGDMSKIEGGELYGTMAGKELISSTVTGVMDGQDAGEFLGSFATNFAGGFVSHKIGDLGVKYGLEDGSIPKAFLHGAASGSLSSINGGEFGIGAASGALGELAGSYIDPDSKRGKGAVALAASTGALFMGGNAKDITLAGDNASRAFEYNRELHDEERKTLKVIEERVSPEEYELYKALTFNDVKGYRGIREDDPRHTESQHLREIYASTSADEQAKIRAYRASVAKELGYDGGELFKYSTLYRWTDSLAKRDKVLTKTGGGVRVVGGIFTFVAGGALSVAEGGKTLYTDYKPREGDRIFDSFSRPVDSYAVLLTTGALETAADVSGVIGKLPKGVGAGYRMIKAGNSARGTNPNPKKQHKVGNGDYKDKQTGSKLNPVYNKSSEDIRQVSNGRAGRQTKLRELSKDDKVSSANRGWIRQEINQIQRGKRTNIRNPKGKELSHKRGYEAAKGYDYKHSDLQDKDLHKLQHKYDDFGRKNKTPKRPKG